MNGNLARELANLLSPEQVVTIGPELRAALQDGTGNRGIKGEAEALLLPADAEEVAEVMAWCYGHGVPLTVRGGGTGLAGGAVPDGGVVLSLERLARVRSIDPELWRMEVEAGVRTATVHRIALENGLMFPPDPGASEQSTIGGNIATNAGGPHAFRYGVTGAWVTGIEAVVPPGEVLSSGGPLRKNVAGLDLTDLMIGSEGTLGIVTSAWLRLVPAPEERGVVVGFYPDTASGCEAIGMIMGSGIQPTALEFLDRGALESSLGSFPSEAPEQAGFAVIAEADGSAGEVNQAVGDLEEAMAGGALQPPVRITDHVAIRNFWAWRDGVSIAVTAQRGGKISEDVVVPVESLAAAVDETVEIGRRHDLPACSWGHAGDGNLHSSFLVDLADDDQMKRGGAAAAEIFEMAIRLGGSISGEHGIGSLKTGHVEAALGPVAVRLQAEIKRVFDPKLLLNPGKKIPLP
ncbi:MAG TPA: FAD-binding oxidoreductase [Solirubrobacterales bacterium]|nr:FAD-binding oxidoreductase [Solirubrobacterales bacterium]MCB0871113.1 FAD-binding oxidoreductase [Solirubrobacterales bacterium]HMU27727.1 FAD-binding oxidoreductase [Solirubrobacterales bacterium]HMW44576.1 FAD-binding oxidoreductase [Solirubrobacterales bacterium]HMX70836.1 FAD-binding oxidoreductase [Solirubrobacterales bacterium]